MEANDLARKTVEFALPDIGKLETPRGSNSDNGGVIDLAQNYCNFTPGHAYCASYCSWCIHKAGKELAITPEFKKSGSALGLVTNNPDLVIAKEDFDASCIPCIGINQDLDGIHGHAFIVIGLDETTGTLQTIDPNSDPNGSREGLGIFLLNKRNVNDPLRKCYIRIA